MRQLQARRCSFGSSENTKYLTRNFHHSVSSYTDIQTILYYFTMCVDTPSQKEDTLSQKEDTLSLWLPLSMCFYLNKIGTKITRSNLMREHLLM
jgi:hypothetical protein